MYCPVIIFTAQGIKNTKSRELNGVGNEDNFPYTKSHEKEMVKEGDAFPYTESHGHGNGER